MSVYLGVDIGTSSVKALLCDEHGAVVAEANAPLGVSRPRPLWSEQDPDDWWRAVDRAVSSLRARSGDAWIRLRGIGLSGQMHGATLLGRDGTPLRPAILWNDGRSSNECREIEEAVPGLHGITGNLAMPGFTAPKLLWVRHHEPDVFARVAHVLLPKDYVRLRMTGDLASDLSDASGTLWVDVGARRWSQEVLAACGLGLEAMPRLHEGPEVTGRLRAEVADAWGCDRVEVVAGGGDNAAGAIGVGVVEAGRAFLSLGTSGVYFVAGDAFRPNPAKAVHAFCHALPGRWHQMSVLLSAASCLGWVTRLTGAADEAALLDEVQAVDRPSRRLMFLPYLSGERTPHNDPWASGVFVGLDHETDRAALARAVLEGVAHAFAEAERVLLESGGRIDDVTVIGGGARSRTWGRILASTLDRPLVYREGAVVGPALGAARLAMMGVGGVDERDACRPGAVVDEVEPEPGLVAHYRERQPLFAELYPNLRAAFRASAALIREDPA